MVACRTDELFICTTPYLWICFHCHCIFTTYAQAEISCASDNAIWASNTVRTAFSDHIMQSTSQTDPHFSDHIHADPKTECWDEIKKTCIDARNANTSLKDTVDILKEKLLKTWIETETTDLVNDPERGWIPGFKKVSLGQIWAARTSELFFSLQRGVGWGGGRWWGGIECPPNLYKGI